MREEHQNTWFTPNSGLYPPNCHIMQYSFIIRGYNWQQLLSLTFCSPILSRESKSRLLKHFSYLIISHHFILLTILKQARANHKPISSRDAYSIFSRLISTGLFYAMNYMINPKENLAPMKPDRFKVAICNTHHPDLCKYLRSFTWMIRATYPSKCIPGLMQNHHASDESLLLQLIQNCISKHQKNQAP